MARGVACYGRELRACTACRRDPSVSRVFCKSPPHKLGSRRGYRLVRLRRRLVLPGQVARRKTRCTGLPSTSAKARDPACRRTGEVSLAPKYPHPLLKRTVRSPGRAAVAPRAPWLSGRSDALLPWPGGRPLPLSFMIAISLSFLDWEECEV